MPVNAPRASRCWFVRRADWRAAARERIDGRQKIALRGRARKAPAIDENGGCAAHADAIAELLSGLDARDLRSARGTSGCVGGWLNAGISRKRLPRFQSQRILLGVDEVHGFRESPPGGGAPPQFGRG